MINRTLRVTVCLQRVFMFIVGVVSMIGSAHEHILHIVMMWMKCLVSRMC